MVEHSENCPKVAKYNRCIECIRKYDREQKQRRRKEIKKQAEMKIQTRSVITKKKTKYDHVICQQCKNKQVRNFCSKCSHAYIAAKQTNYRQMV